MSRLMLNCGEVAFCEAGVNGPNMSSNKMCKLNFSFVTQTALAHCLPLFTKLCGQASVVTFFTTICRNMQHHHHGCDWAFIIITETSLIRLSGAGKASASALKASLLNFPSTFAKRWVTFLRSSVHKQQNHAASYFSTVSAKGKAGRCCGQIFIYIYLQQTWTSITFNKQMYNCLVSAANPTLARLVKFDGSEFFYQLLCFLFFHT